MLGFIKQVCLFNVQLLLNETHSPGERKRVQKMQVGCQDGLAG